MDTIKQKNIITEQKKNQNLYKSLTEDSLKQSKGSVNLKRGHWKSSI